MSDARATREFHFVPKDGGEVHAVMGDPMRFIMTSADTSGAYALSDQRVRPGNGAPPHIHHNEDESFFVLDGSFRVQVGEDLHDLGPGEFVHVARGAVRSFMNIGEGEGRILILHVPGSASGFYIAMGKLPFPPDMNDVVRLGQQFGIEVLMPNS